MLCFFFFPPQFICELSYLSHKIIKKIYLFLICGSTSYINTDTGIQKLTTYVFVQFVMKHIVLTEK